jgi:hypothetical protein
MKRRGALLLTAALALLAGCGRDAPTAPPAPTAAAAAKPAAVDPQDDPARGGARKGSWIRAESEHQDLPIVWELRDDYTAPESPPRRLLVVSQAREVPFVGRNDAAKHAEFVALEQRLLDALAGHADLVAVLDWRQQHDWYFYADDPVTRERVTEALGGAAGRSVRIDIESDGGQFYTTLKQRVSGKPQLP